MALLVLELGNGPSGWGALIKHQHFEKTKTFNWDAKRCHPGAGARAVEASSVLFFFFFFFFTLSACKEEEDREKKGSKWTLHRFPLLVWSESTVMLPASVPVVKPISLPFQILLTSLNGLFGDVFWLMFRCFKIWGTEVFRDPNQFTSQSRLISNKF